MKVKVLSSNPAEVKTSALLVLLFKEENEKLTNRSDLAGLAPSIEARLKAKDFEAKAGQSLCLYPQDGAAERIILTGLGCRTKCGPSQLKAAAALASSRAKELGADKAALLLPAMPGLSEEKCAELTAIGANLGQYSFDQLKSPDKAKPALKELSLIRQGGKGLAAVRKAAQDGAALAEAIAWARDLGNTPANLLYPETMALAASDMAQAWGIEIRIISQEEAEEQGMGSFVGVAQGSERSGRVLVLKYQGGAKKDPPVVLVGKAITFDSGGISLKNREGMGDMKADMAGGAAVLAALRAASALKLKRNVIGVVAAAENMPDGGAYRPGDVLKAQNGKSIEIISTDAEGRLVLADALNLAQTFKPKAVVDLATLTGGCVVALGTQCAAVMGNSQKLSQELLTAAKASGELLWELPLLDEYNELLKSPVADIRNSGGKWGSSILGGLFLQHFVRDETLWAHMDIAGPAFTDKASPGIPKGATGYGVQLLVDWLRN